MTERRYAGLRADERAAQRYEQLLAAGLDSFAGRGWSGSTVQDICRNAGLSPRYFYELFDSRESLFVAVTDRIAEEVRATVLAALDSSTDPHQRATAVLASIEAYFATDPRTIRVALMESLATERFRAQRRDLLTMFSALGATLMRPLRAEPARRDAARRRLELNAGVLTGGLVEVLISWEGGAQSVRPRIADLADLYTAAANA